MNTKVIPPQSQIFLKLQSILSEITGIDPEEIVPSMDIAELRMSPVDLAEFKAQVKQLIGYELTRSDFEEFETLAELADMIEDELN